jgi:hypothetical protein
LHREVGLKPHGACELDFYGGSIVDARYANIVDDAILSPGALHGASDSGNSDEPSQQAAGRAGKEGT